VRKTTGYYLCWKGRAGGRPLAITCAGKEEQEEDHWLLPVLVRKSRRKTTGYYLCW